MREPTPAIVNASGLQQHALKTLLSDNRFQSHQTIEDSFLLHRWRSRIILE